MPRVVALLLLLLVSVVDGFTTTSSVRRSHVRCLETMDKTTENPGKAVLDEMAMAKQSSDLDALAANWQRKRELVEWESSKLTGFSEQAEIINGRAAMFFIVTGLLTEYWTGQSIPEQIVTLLRTTGVIGL